MKTSILLVAVAAMPFAAFAQSNPQPAGTYSGHGNAPEGMPANASQMNPQTNPGTSSTAPGGTSRTRITHHRTPMSDTNSAGASSPTTPN